jgi:hypothetical protein
MKVGLAFAAALAAAVFGLSQARAAEMIFTETTTAHGSLNGVNFNNLVTITGEADTNDIYSPFAGAYRDNLYVTVTVQGLGTAHLTDEMYVVSNQNNHDAGFIDLTQGGNGLLFTAGIDNSGYDLSTPFGPVTGIAGIGNPQIYATDQGNFILSGPPRSTTFQAMLAPVPESSTWLLMTGGLGLLGAVLRRRRTLALV